MQQQSHYVLIALPMCYQHEKHRTCRPGYANRQGGLPDRDLARSELDPRTPPELVRGCSPVPRQSGIANSLDEDQPWYRVANVQVACTRIGVLDCPSFQRRSERTGGDTLHRHRRPRDWIRLSCRRATPGPGIFGYDRRITLADIKDGAVSTMVLAESARVAGSWLAGGPATVRGLDPAEQPYVGAGRQFGGMHSLVS